MISKKTRQKIIEHSKECYPLESCGLIVGKRYIPCTNISEHANQFEIDPRDWVRCSKMKGQISAIVHSHPDGSTNPSMADLVEMERHGLPWIITNGSDCATHAPKGYKAPLLGRDYFHAIMDCYTLIQDYFERELGIILGDYERQDKWWESKEQNALYVENFKNEGFIEVDSPQKHDIVLCRVGRTEHVNHACVFIGNGELSSEDTPKVIGDSLILHHPYGRQSVREIYGEQWQRRTHVVIRHKSLM